LVGWQRTRRINVIDTSSSVRQTKDDKRIKMLEEQLVNGIKITKLQKELHRMLREFETRRLKATIPLRKQHFD